MNGLAGVHESRRAGAGERGSNLFANVTRFTNAANNDATFAVKAR